VFTGSVAIARKSGFLEILAYEMENSNEVADFEAILARNRLSIAYFGFNNGLNQMFNYFHTQNL
jgi:hypothetical protein